MVTPDPILPTNRLLAALPPSELNTFRPYLESVELDIKDSLYEPNQLIEDVYFPETAIASILAQMEDGSAVEVATVGNEGLVGMPIFLGAESTPTLCFIQIPGRALRMRTGDFRALVRHGSSMQLLLSRYTQAMFMQLSQSVACNRLHVIEQRCCRWLLMTHDRVGGDNFPLTQEFLAQMLGVRRASVNEVATKLESMGLITYARGWITVLDRKGLEELSCECYGIIKAEYERLTP